jgi:hypothetical protein
VVDCLDRDRIERAQQEFQARPLRRRRCAGALLCRVGVCANTCGARQPRRSRGLRRLHRRSPTTRSCATAPS